MIFKVYKKKKLKQKIVVWHIKNKMTNTTDIDVGIMTYDDLSFALCGIVLITLLYCCLFRKEREYEQDLI